MGKTRRVRRQLKKRAGKLAMPKRVFLSKKKNGEREIKPQREKGHELYSKPPRRVCN